MDTVHSIAKLSCWRLLHLLYVWILCCVRFISYLKCFFCVPASRSIKKLPRHLALLVDSEDVVLHVSKVILLLQQLAQLGLRHVSLYDAKGKLKAVLPGALKGNPIVQAYFHTIGQQTHEVGESSRPPQTEDEIFRTQLVTAVAMFTQAEPAKAQPQVIHTTVSMETPVHLPETMQSPNPVHNVQEQVAGTSVLQAAPVQPATFQQPLVGSNGQGSDLQAMQQVFPPPSIHPGYFGGGSVFQSMAGDELLNQDDKVFSEAPSYERRDCLRVELICLQDGKRAIVEAARNICCKSWQLGALSNLREDDVDISLKEIGGIGPDPDLLLLFSSSRCLQGYPPWRLRLTEIQYIGSIKNASEQTIFAALDEFSYKNHRYGK
ncbi:hypothetical protein L7F22_037709 [Adiantum nelumboides]|nr:hypothetical protein [Adiantum nelumboides]